MVVRLDANPGALKSPGQQERAASVPVSAPQPAGPGPDQYSHAQIRPVVAGVFVDNVQPAGGARPAVVEKYEKMEQFAETFSFLQHGQQMIVLFSASWCDGCKKYKPVFENLAREAGGKYRFVNVEDDEFAAGQPNIPIVLLFTPEEMPVEFPIHPMSMAEIEELIVHRKMPVEKRLDFFETGFADPDLKVRLRNFERYVWLALQLERREDFSSRMEKLRKIFADPNTDRASRLKILLLYAEVIRRLLSNENLALWNNDLETIAEKFGPGISDRLIPNHFMVGIHGGKFGPQFESMGGWFFELDRNFYLGPRIALDWQLGAWPEPTAGAMLVAGFLSLGAAAGYRQSINENPPFPDGWLMKYNLGIGLADIGSIGAALGPTLTIEHEIKDLRRAAVLGGISLFW